MFASIYTILTILLISYLLVALFRAISGRSKDDSKGFITFFLIIFFATWATSIWIEPFGPTFVGVYYLPIIFLGLLFLLALAAATDPYHFSQGSNKAESQQVSKEVEAEVEAAGAVVGLFFWLFLILMILSIVTRYTWQI